MEVDLTVFLVTAPHIEDGELGLGPGRQITKRACRPLGRPRLFPRHGSRPHSLFGHCSTNKKPESLGSAQGVNVLPRDHRVLGNCGVDIPKGLEGVPLAAEVLVDPVKTLSPFFGSFCLSGQKLSDCSVVTLVLFVQPELLNMENRSIPRSPGRTPRCHQGA